LVVGAPGVPDSVLRQLIGVVYLQPKRKFFFGLHQAFLPKVPYMTGFLVISPVENPFFFFCAQINLSH
jgi:hypothetical protein